MQQNKRELCLHVRHQAFQILAQLPEDPEQAARILECALRLLRDEMEEPAPPIELKVVG